jgi:uncharacterized protein (DUF1786 family)
LKILAIDIGLGTQDILLYEGGGPVENCPKLVLPSPSSFYRKRLTALLSRGKDLFLDGSIIGGGDLISPLVAHMRAGFSVFMTQEAALTLRNDLDKVRAQGIQIVEGPPPNFAGERLTLREIDFYSLAALLAPWDIDLNQVEIAAIAVQDHGVSPPGMSNRRFRLQSMKEGLSKDPRPTSLAFLPGEIPAFHLRMRAASEASRKQLPKARPLLMDTSLAAISGCLVDPLVATRSEKPILCVNLGNGHTMAALLEGGRILALLEHHTKALNPEDLKRDLMGFADGKLKDEDVFERGGHGLFYLQDPPGFPEVSLIAATGPQREMMGRSGLAFYYPAPYGDMMMTGPAGLIWAAEEKLSLKSL